MQDLIKESESEFEEKLNKRVEKGGFTYLYETRDEIDSQSILDWHTKQMEKAYNKGREDSFNKTDDIKNYEYCFKCKKNTQNRLLDGEMTCYMCCWRRRLGRELLGNNTNII